MFLNYVKKYLLDSMIDICKLVYCRGRKSEAVVKYEWNGCVSEWVLQIDQSSQKEHCGEDMFFFYTGNKTGGILCFVSVFV